MDLPTTYYVAPGDGTQYGASSASSTPQALGKDDFLRLLVAQLKYQDPLDPMDNAEFMAQTAQFSTLEELQNLNSAMAQQGFVQKVTQAAGMVGMQAQVLDPLSGEMVTSPITGLTIQGGDVMFIINDLAYRFEDLVEVYGQTNGVENSVEDGLGLIGKDITVRDANGATHSGYCWAVEVHEGEVFVRVGDEGRFPLDEIVQVSDPGPGELTAGEIAEASGLIGQYAKVKHPETGNTVEGVIEGIAFSPNSGMHVTVNGGHYSYSDILELVSDPQ